jgi:hypothetical protein
VRPEGSVQRPPAWGLDKEFSKLTGSIIPHSFLYALPVKPYLYDPAKA